MERIKSTKESFTFTERQIDYITALAQYPEKEWTKKLMTEVAVQVGYKRTSAPAIRRGPNILKAARYIQKKIPFDIIPAPEKVSVGSPDIRRKEGDPLWSNQQELFCQELVADIDQNTRLAAERAGYVPEYGSKLIKKEQVRRRITELRKERFKRLRPNVDAIVTNLMQIANTNITDYARWEGDRLAIEDSAKISRAKMYCIKEIKSTKKGVGLNKIETLEIKLEDKQRALRLLMEHLGIEKQSDDPQEFAAKLRKLSNELQDRAIPGGKI